MKNRYRRARRNRALIAAAFVGSAILSFLWGVVVADDMDRAPEIDAFCGR